MCVFPLYVWPPYPLMTGPTTACRCLSEEQYPYQQRLDMTIFAGPASASLAEAIGRLHGQLSLRDLLVHA